MEIRDQQNQQIEKNEQQQKRILELTKKVCYLHYFFFLNNLFFIKIEELEKVVATSIPNIDRLTDNSSVSTNHTKSPNTESVVLRPPDIPERIPIRSRTNSGQQFFSSDRPPSRNTSGSSSVRIPSISLEKITNNNNKKIINQLDFEVDRSPLLNHSVQMDKSQLAKTRPRNLPSKRLSNPLLDEATNHQNDDADNKTSNIKEQTTSMSINKLDYHPFFLYYLELPNNNNNNNNNIVTDEVKIANIIDEFNNFYLFLSLLK